MTASRARPEHEDLLAHVIEAADRASELVMSHYGNAQARMKSDASPVTAADEAAEAVIVGCLRSHTPGVSVVAEEDVARSGVPAEAGDLFWLVDPLDGTREFLDRNGEFTINIALVEHGRPVLAVVGAPARSRLYASDGRRALRRDGRAALEPIRARPRPADGLVAAVSRSHMNEQTETFLKGLPVIGRKVGGSALKFCLVAEGAADIYPRFGRTMEWDTAAGHGVLAASGGSVCGLDGRELAYGKPGFENPDFVAWGAPGAG